MAEKIDWARVGPKIAPRLSGDDKRIVEWLAAGKNQVEIAQMLGVKRWRVWRRVKDIKEMVVEGK